MGVWFSGTYFFKQVRSDGKLKECWCFIPSLFILFAKLNTIILYLAKLGNRVALSNHL